MIKRKEGRTEARNNYKNKLFHDKNFFYFILLVGFALSYQGLFIIHQLESKMIKKNYKNKKKKN